MAFSDDASISEIPSYLNMELDDLYALLVSDSDREAYSKKGRIIRGKDIFNKLLPLIRETICEKYRQRASTANHAIDFATIVATSLAGNVQFAGLPVIPIAALVTKLGLDELCNEQ